MTTIDLALLETVTGGRGGGQKANGGGGEIHPITATTEHGPGVGPSFGPFSNMKPPAAQALTSSALDEKLALKTEKALQSLHKPRNNG